MNPEYKNTRFRIECSADEAPPVFGVVTACNPNGETLADEINAMATADFRNALDEAGLTYFRVDGGSLNGDHIEPGFGVVFSGLDECIAWGRRYQQQAIFWVEDGRVNLVNCDTSAAEFVGSWSSLVLESN